GHAVEAPGNEGRDDAGDLEAAPHVAGGEGAAVAERQHERVEPRVPPAAGKHAHPGEELGVGAEVGERLVEIAEVAHLLEGAGVWTQVAVDEPRVLPRPRELAEAAAAARQQA